MGNFLVTGSSGYIGAQVSKKLRLHNQNVVGVDLHGSEISCNLADGFRFPANLTKSDTVLVHLAAKFPGSAPRKDLLLKSRLITRNLLLGDEDYKAAVVVSSSAVYSRSLVNRVPVVEPWESYGRAKLEMENRFLECSFPLSILRPGTILGPGRRGGIVNLLKSAADGKPVLLPRCGDVVHPFVHEEDVVDSIVSECLRFNINDESSKVLDLIASRPVTISSAMGELSMKKLLAPKVPSRIFNLIGSDSFPLFGVSKWHAGALLYDFRGFENKNFHSKRSMFETIQSVLL